jgi:group I intron endonuclease
VGRCYNLFDIEGLGGMKMLNKSGVYKITNTKNNKSYIGCSENIKIRWSTHKTRYKDLNSKEYNKKLYVAMRNDSFESFTIEILEECEKEELLNREKYYIEKYNTLINGYNEKCSLDRHGKSKMTLGDVIDIRTRYNNLERKQDVYADYSNIINKTGFHKIWNGYTWSNVIPEVYTGKNKEFHKNNTSNIGQKNGTSILTEGDVFNIRTRRKEGENRVDVYEDYKHLLTCKSFSQVWYGYNWKHVIV